MTELALFELMSEADCELLARSDVRVNVRRKIGMRIALIAAILSTVLVATLFVGAFAAVRNFKEQHPDIQGGLVEVLSVALSDEQSILSEMLPENVKLELGELIVKLGGENPFVPLGPGESETETKAETEAETKNESNNGLPWHSECEYCGNLDGEGRWFIAKVVDANHVKPIGENCFEAYSAGEAGFRVNFFGENLIEKQGLVAGDIVLVAYNGYVVETALGQIYPDSIELIKQHDTQQDNALPEPSTNLEFWIAENVDGVDFSEYREKYGLFGGRQYYGKGYLPTEDEYGQQVDPAHCVIYTVTSYPDYADKEQHITCIEITDPEVIVYGITVNSSFEEFERMIPEYGFELQETNGNNRMARQGKFFVSFDGERIIIQVEVENKDGIIF